MYNKVLLILLLREDKMNTILINIHVPKSTCTYFSATVQNSKDKLDISLYHSESYFQELNLNARYKILKNLTKLGEANIEVKFCFEEKLYFCPTLCLRNPSFQTVECWFISSHQYRAFARL